MNRIAGRARIVLLLGLVLIAGLSFFVVEYTIEAENWVISPGSPHLYTGGNIGTGVVLDRDGTVLLNLNESRTYSEDLQIRMSTVHWLGDRNGSINAPALPYYASQLAGFELINGVYHYGEQGGLAQLTLSSAAQQVALEVMGSYKGTVAVYNYKTGELLCAVTTPTFDPDNVPDLEADTEGLYEGMYFNRFIQSAYIPGSIFKVVTLAAALEEISDIEQQTFYCDGTYEFGVDSITCESAHGTVDLQTAFRYSCNCAFAQIALQLGGEKLEAYVEKFGLTQSLTFDGITTAAGNFQAAGEADVNVAWSSVGQYNDQINPCAFMTFMGAIAGDGTVVTPYLVEQIISGTDRTYRAKTQIGDTVLSPETAEKLQNYMRANVQLLYGDTNFGGLQVCAKTGTAQVGGDKKPNAMLAGFVLDEEYPLAFVVCVEDGGYGSTVCLPIAAKVLEACKKAID